MAPGPTPHDETATDADSSPGNRIESDHAGRQHCQYDEGCTALPCAVGPREHNRSAPDQQCDREDHAAALREPKPPTEPAPVASKRNHARNARSEKRAHGSTCVRE
jgi:hypothetical protein